MGRPLAEAVWAPSGHEVVVPPVEEPVQAVQNMCRGRRVVVQEYMEVVDAARGLWAVTVSIPTADLAATEVRQGKKAAKRAAYAKIWHDVHYYQIELD